MVVLTTPAAEVMVAPVAREETAIQALSPGFHHFLASVRGLEVLLDRAGLAHHRVVRMGSSLQAVAALTADGLASIAADAAVDQAEMLAYLDAAANAAPPGSALASGMAYRHFRACVMHGDYEAAAASYTRVREVMLARHALDLDDPGACTSALSAGRRPAWNLIGIAYAAGMLELLSRHRPARAVGYFELAVAAATAWGNTSGLLDEDAWNLRELSLGHRCLALAACEPGAAEEATERLRDVLDERSPADVSRLAWWKARTFNELVALGFLDEQPGFVAEVQSSVDTLVWSSDAAYRRTGLTSSSCSDPRAQHRVADRRPAVVHPLLSRLRRDAAGRRTRAVIG